MALRTRVLAFAPLAFLTLAAGAGAALGLRADSDPRITATEWPDAVHQLLEAPGVRFDYVTRNVFCSDPANADLCANSTRTKRETGFLTFSPTSYDSEVTFESDEPGGTMFAFRARAEQEFVRLPECWTRTPAPSSSVVPAVALLRLADPAVEAPATDVLDLLGVSSQLWEHYGFSEELRLALLHTSLPVSWTVEDGDLVVHLDGTAVARALAPDFPSDTQALSHIADKEASWRATPLEDEPEIRDPGATCID